MKRFLSFGVTLATLLFMVSCTKTAPTPPVTNANPIEGLWVGTYMVTDGAYLGEYYYQFDIFADHTIMQQGGGSGGQSWGAKGTWTLTHDTLFTATIASIDLTVTPLTQTITAVYDSTKGTLSNGTWTYTSGGIRTGSFSLKRVQ